MSLPNIAAVLYNNPGDVSLPIAGWPTDAAHGVPIQGIPGQPNYGHFPTMKIGWAAFQQRLKSYIAEGLPPRVGPMNTIRKIGAHYATATAWPEDVAKYSGIPIDAPLSESNAAQIAALSKGILRIETSTTLAQWMASPQWDPKDAEA